jgi:hypothetical protein
VVIMILLYSSGTYLYCQQILNILQSICNRDKDLLICYSYYWCLEPSFSNCSRTSIIFCPAIKSILGLSFSLGMLIFSTCIIYIPLKHFIILLMQLCLCLFAFVTFIEFLLNFVSFGFYPVNIIICFSNIRSRGLSF